MFLQVTILTEGLAGSLGLQAQSFFHVTQKLAGVFVRICKCAHHWTRCDKALESTLASKVPPPGDVPGPGGAELSPAGSLVSLAFCWPFDLRQGEREGERERNREGEVEGERGK